MTLSSHAPFDEHGWGMIIRDMEYLYQYVAGSNDVAQDTPQSVAQSNAEPQAADPPQLTGFDGMGGAGNLGQPASQQAAQAAVIIPPVPVVTYPITAPLGGTGVASPTAHGVLVAEGASPMVAITTATPGLPLVSFSGADPGFAILGLAGGGSNAATAAGARANFGLNGIPLFQNLATFTTTGTWTVPAGIVRCLAILVGGGAGGGGGHATLAISGGGGGAGGVAYGYFTVTPASTPSVIVGGAGAGGAIGGTGSTGGQSQFSSGSLSADGGAAGGVGFGGRGGVGQTASGALAWVTSGHSGLPPSILSYTTSNFNLTAGGSAAAITGISPGIGFGGHGTVWQSTEYGLGGNGGTPGGAGTNGQPGIVLILY